MTEQDTQKLHAISIGDTIEYLDRGQTQRAMVEGWTSNHTDVPMILLADQRRVPLYRVLSRERPGQPGVVRFNETISSSEVN